MSKPATTRLSSKGQIVIPEQVRNKLGLEPGAEFVVVGEGDAIVLHLVRAPAMAEFKNLLATARRQARRAGLTKNDVEAAIRDVRS